MRSLLDVRQWPRRLARPANDGFLLARGLMRRASRTVRVAFWLSGPRRPILSSPCGLARRLRVQGHLPAHPWWVPSFPIRGRREPPEGSFCKILLVASRCFRLGPTEVPGSRWPVARRLRYPRLAGAWRKLTTSPISAAAPPEQTLRAPERLEHLVGPFGIRHPVIGQPFLDTRQVRPPPGAAALPRCRAMFHRGDQRIRSARSLDTVASATPRCLASKSSRMAVIRCAAALPPSTASARSHSVSKPHRPIIEIDDPSRNTRSVRSQPDGRAVAGLHQPRAVKSIAIGSSQPCAVRRIDDDELRSVLLIQPLRNASAAARRNAGSI
ncbi:unnamed protein product [Acanthosepion pharaonis]|uniref:Uncharacterized protein n=1 Tax=Acanthosepion pharaonis TaxID=158019 RepID=A0A812DAJ1_ACAPH|nr:unnamed protein product [Sepia pharaonis]